MALLAISTYRDGIDVFQNRSIFRTVNIGRMADVDVRGADLFTEGERIFHLFADHGQVREPLEGHLFGVARSADDAQLVERDAVAAVDVFGDGHVILRYDAFDRRDDEFVLQRYRQRLAGRFQVDGRHGQDQHIGFGNDRVDVV